MIQFHVFKLIESINNYYIYLISHVEDPELFLEEVEHSVANALDKPYNQYLSTCDWDSITIEKASVNPVDVIHNHLPQDDKCINVSNSYISLIPPPKEKKKREPKPKAEPKKPAKPRGKKTGVTIDMNQQVVDPSV